MPTTLPLTGDGAINQNSTTPADGQFKLSDVGSGYNGATLTFRGSDATSGNYDGGEIVLKAGIPLYDGSGQPGLIKIAGLGGREIHFNLFGYPRITFVGSHAVINFPYNNSIYFGEDTYTGCFIIRGCKCGVGTGDTAAEKLDVNGNIKLGGGGFNNGHLVMGNYHLWAASNGTLRICSYEPTSDSDGSVVGVQV